MSLSADNPAWLREIHDELSLARERAHLLLAFFINDFCSLWNALAKVSNDEMDGRSNFLFAKEAMRLLELICRGCTSEELLNSFSKELNSRNPFYFIHIPVFQEYKPQGIKTLTEGTFSGINLPRSSSGSPILLWLLFDMLRNGITHHAIQCALAVGNDRIFIGVAGNQHLGNLAKCDEQSRYRNLRWDRGSSTLTVFPETLFLDFVWAVRESGIFRDSRFVLEYPYRTGKMDLELWKNFRKELDTLKLQ